MKLIHLVSTFWKYPFQTKYLVLTIFIRLGIARLIILTTKFSTISKKMGTPKLESTQKISMHDLDFLKTLKLVVSQVSPYTFWESNCYTKALCVSQILKSKDISYTVYFGLRKNELLNEFDAHAWLRVGDILITGGEDIEGYKVTGLFGWPELRKS